MSRVSKIKYNPNLSVAENAEKNHTSEATIRTYLQAHCIDRRREAKIVLINAIKEYLLENPLASKNAVSRNVIVNGDSLSIQTVRKYWDYATGKKELTEYNTNKKQLQADKNAAKLSKFPTEEIIYYLDSATSLKNKKIRQGKKKREQFSEALQDIPELLKKADETDVSQLREFLLEKPEMPMLFIGNGGKNDWFPALLYGMNKGVGVTLTPLQFASLSDEAVKSSRIMLMSKGGRNLDIDYASQRAAALNPDNTACFTYSDSSDSKLLENLNGTTAKKFIFKDLYDEEGFLSVRGKFLTDSLFYKAFSGVDNISSLIEVDLNPENCFKYVLNNATAEPDNLEKIEHFCILYSGYGEPVAKSFESVLSESGMASVQVSDMRNYCHGRFMFPTNFTENHDEPRYKSNVAMVLLVSPRERNLAKQVREKAIPKKTPTIIIETDYDSALASIDLLIKTYVLIGYLGEQCKKINPFNPPNFNPEIDKQVPKSDVKFSNLKELQYVGGKKPQQTSKKKEVNVAELKSMIDKLMKDEKRNSKSLNHLPQPTLADLTRWEEYDASKFLCCAFRDKNDRWNGKWIPFGNMNGGFGYDVQGIHFKNSEAAYICGMFSDNTPKHIEIQKQLIAENSGFSAKKYIRSKNEHLARKDWNEFNQQWMIWVVWNKIQGNEDFRNLLMDIPDNAIIIEDSSRQKGTTAAFWGTKNNERKDFADILKKYLDTTFPNTSEDKRDEMWLKVLNAFCNYGTYRGSNVMGKILTICRKCLQDGTEPPIDYELLKSKHIHLLGKELSFDEPILPIKREEPQLKKGDYTIVELTDFAKAKSYEGDFGICYCKKKDKFNYYTDEGNGKLYLCLKDGYKDLKKPVVKRGDTFDRYDDYASSAIGVSIGSDGSIKAINSRYPWNNGGTDSDYSKEELEYMIGKPFNEAFVIPKVEQPKEKVAKEKKVSSKQKPIKPIKQEYPLEGKLYHSVLGAIIGDISGSSREGNNTYRTDIQFFTAASTFTDDSVLTIALADWLNNKDTKPIEKALRYWGNRFRNAGYGRTFKTFLKPKENQPFENTSTSNGAAMRVSPVALRAQSLEEALSLAKESAEPTHSGGGIIGAQAIAAATFIAKGGVANGKSTEEIKADIKYFVETRFNYNLSRSIDDIRELMKECSAKDNEDRNTKKGEDKPTFEQLRVTDAVVSSEMSLIAVMHSQTFEEAIRLAVSMGGDSDTVAAMAGAVAAQLFGIPEAIVNRCLIYLPSEMIDVINKFEGSNFQPTGIKPPKISRWCKEDIVVYGADIEKNKRDEEGKYETIRGARMKGYPILTIDKNLDEIQEGVKKFIEEAKMNPNNRYLVHKVGYDKAGYTLQQIAPMFKDAVELRNVLLPEEMVNELKEKE